MAETLKNVDRAAYAGVRTFLAAGAALWDRWDQTGRNMWPESDPNPSTIMNLIFEYVPLDALVMSPEMIADDPDCQVPGRSSSCFYLRGDIVFSPENRAAIIQALDARTPAAVKAEFDKAGVKDDSDLEFWATAIIAGGLIALGGLPFAGAALAKIAGYLFASWAVYQFVTPKTPGGQSIASKYLNTAKEGFDNLLKGASNILVLVIAALGIYFLVKD